MYVVLLLQVQYIISVTTPDGRVIPRKCIQGNNLLSVLNENDGAIQAPDCSVVTEPLLKPATITFLVPSILETPSDQIADPARSGVNASDQVFYSLLLKVAGTDRLPKLEGMLNVTGRQLQAALAGNASVTGAVDGASDAVVFVDMSPASIPGNVASVPVFFRSGMLMPRGTWSEN